MIAAHDIHPSASAAPSLAAAATPRADNAPQRPHTDPLAALLFSTAPLADVAASLNLSLSDLLALYHSPEFQASLAAIDDLTQTRLRIHAAQARLTAIQALESLTTSTQDPVERRRAAANLMRATVSTCHRSPLADVDAAPATDPDNPDRPRHLRPRPRQLPSRRLYPDQVARLIARALADNDTPAPDSGLATLHAFLSADTRAASPHLPDFIAAAHDQFDDHAGDAQPPSPAAAAQGPAPSASPADLPLPDLPALADLLAAAPSDAWTCSTPTQHARTATVDLHPSPPIAHSRSPMAPAIRFHLTRPDTGPDRMCWLIDRITRTPAATGPPNEP